MARMDVQSRLYAERLVRAQTARWKQWLDVQAPYRWNLRRLDPGFTLDIGCGIGRNLIHLGGNGVGIDVNEHCLRVARDRGFVVFTPDEFERSVDYHAPGRFDSLLLAHVAEHLGVDETVSLLARYAGLVRDNGQVILITPQEAGQASDPTHVEFVDFGKLARIAACVGCRPDRSFSFPLPRWAGRFFAHNEFVVVSTKPAASADGPRTAAN